MINRFEAEVQTKKAEALFCTGARARIRTWDPISISDVLYQLSYTRIHNFFHSRYRRIGKNIANARLLGNAPIEGHSTHWDFLTPEPILKNLEAYDFSLHLILLIQADYSILSEARAIILSIEHIIR